ncbi:MAG: PTS sugar transporter subunit IIA [Anaerolineales bacterium]|nr:PTS sugar transporter subunit IIA [Anaerolineales bacterium]MDW8227578.1 PTS sugar transporter subunit IIA [Anaerolineales bacterium]
MGIGLQTYLVPEATVLGLAAESAEQVIVILSEKLKEAGYVHASFVQNVLAREQNQPTGLPLQGKYNAAIPHTDSEFVIKPGVAVATLARPVLFRNMVSPSEQIPVHLVFLLALDQPKSQIAMLQELSQVLQKAELVESIMQSQNLSQINEIFQNLA